MISVGKCLPTAAAIVIGAPALAATDDRRVLFFSGVDMSSVSGFAWGGADASLLGPRSASGPVARLVGGGGSYEYANAEVAGGRVRGEAMTGQALLGWRRFAGTVSATALAGVEAEHHTLYPHDPGNPQGGTNWGARFAGEIWWEPHDRAVLDAHAAYGTAFDSYSARLALGWRATQNIILGPEIATLGNRTSGQLRAGIWVSGLTLGAANFRISAGALRDDDGENGAYGSLGAHLAW